MTHIIAVVGKSGSGKTTFCDLVKSEVDCDHIDIDEIIQSSYDDPKIIEYINFYMGSKYIDNNGKVADIDKIREFVYKNQDKKSVQEFKELMWDIIDLEIEKKIAKPQRFCIA